MREQPTPEPQNVTRRRFIKRSGGATVGTAIGLYALQSPAWAQEGDDSSGKWWLGQSTFSIPTELDHDAVVNQMWGLSTIPPSGEQLVAVSSLFADIDALKAHLDWAAGQKTKKPFTQTVKWEEWLTKPDGTGEQPTKFQKLDWSYDGNHIIDLSWAPTLGRWELLNQKTVGMILFTEAFGNDEIWELKGIALDPATYQTLTGSTTSPLYYPSEKNPIEPDDKAMAVFGTYADNYSQQPQTVSAAGTWAGTNDVGVASFEVRHLTQILAWVRAEMPNGHFVEFTTSGDARLKLENGKNPGIVTVDWKNNRQAQTKNGSHWEPGGHDDFPGLASDLWEIWIKRSDTGNFEK